MFSNIASNILIVGGLIFILSFLMVYLIIPKVIWINRYRKLMVHPNYRSSHKKSTPTMAGFSFLLALIIVIFFIHSWDNDDVSIYYITSLVVIFAVGLKDDLAKSTPKAKLSGEILAVLFILFCNCMQVPSLDGFLGIYELPFIVSNLLMILAVLTIINAFNLIDGIDGLAGSIGITIFSIYALIFYVIDLHYYFLLCVSLIAMLSAYLRYNFSNTEKIFMGDTGSLIMGLSISFFTLKFMAMDPSEFTHFTFKPENKVIVCIAILCIPLFDTFRVIGVRLLHKKNPFQADRNHIHHVLIDLGFSHLNASLLLGMLNYIIVIVLAFESAKHSNYIMIGVLLSIYAIFLAVFYKMKQQIKIQQNKKNKKKFQ
jgi:UDP-N-acetylmuramyl pentapeptide phosphotransferase/UDP-N-acetylglucosamine-1-phosphate transferase